MATIFTQPTKRGHQAKAFGQPQVWAVPGHEQLDACFEGTFDPIEKRDQS